MLSIHARVEGAEPAGWEHPSLVQLWGPRFQVYVIAQRDLAVFSLGRFPDDIQSIMASCIEIEAISMTRMLPLVPVRLFLSTL